MSAATDTPRRPGALRRRLPDPWSAAAAVVAALVILPIASIVWIALTPAENIWPHLMATTLPRYVTNTVVISGAVGLLAAAVGAGAAWLVVMYRFPGRRWLEWLLLLPLAIPAYVGAYALVDFLDYAGPVQSWLRAAFGWRDAQDYWFPEIRSRWAAVLVLAAALYPYVYLLSRATFREQSGNTYEVARMLGLGPWGRFLRLGLPLARPAIAAGTAIVMMETVNDIGVVEFFAVQTLTFGIFTTWLQTGNAAGAAQIALVILAAILMLAGLERAGRRRMRYHNPSRAQRPVTPIPLRGPAGWAATAACTLPVLAGFALPVGVMLSHALAAPEAWLAPGLGRALVNTVAVGGAAALVTVLAALVLVYGVRLSARRLPRLLLPVTLIGYAAPGAVLGLGLLIPLAAFDNALADAVLAVSGFDPGLILTGSAAAIGYAYAVRFFAIAQGAVDSALGRVTPSLEMAARSLGRGPRATLLSVHLPLIRASTGTALLLVFVDCVKELPATLLLRPFGYETLATRVYAKASLEDIVGASPPALMVAMVGLAAVLVMARTGPGRSHG